MRLALALAAAAVLALGVDAAPKPASSLTALTCAPAPAPAKDTSLCAGSGVVLVNEKRRFSIEVPSGLGALTVRLSPSGEGSGDADLEVVPPSDSAAEPKSSREVSRLFECVLFSLAPHGRGRRASPGHAIHTD